MDASSYQTPPGELCAGGSARLLYRAPGLLGVGSVGIVSFIRGSLVNSPQRTSLGLSRDLL